MPTHIEPEQYTHTQSQAPEDECTLAVHTILSLYRFLSYQLVRWGADMVHVLSCMCTFVHAQRCSNQTVLLVVTIFCSLTPLFCFILLNIRVPSPVPQYIFCIYNCEASIHCWYCKNQFHLVDFCHFL